MFRSIVRNVLGSAKIIATTGTSLFGGLKFAEYMGLDESNSMIIGCIVSVGVTGITIITRYFNMSRPQAKSTSYAHLPMLEDSDPTEKTASCTKKISIYFIQKCHPGKNTSHCKIGGYVSTKSTAYIYSIFSASSAILSIQSIISLLRMMTNSTFSEKCGDKNLSPTWQVIIVNVAMFLLMTANLVSFKAYNSPRLQEYYKKLFINGGLKEVKNWKKLTIFLGVAIDTITIMFGNKHMFDSLRENTLCHVTDYQISDNVITIAGYFSITSNFLICTLMNIGAQYNRQKRKIDINRISDYLQFEPNFACLDKPVIKPCIVINGLAKAANTFVSVTVLPEIFSQSKSLPTLADHLENKSLAYNIAILGTASLAALNSFYNQWNLDIEGYRNELRSRKEIREIKEESKEESKEEKKEPLLTSHSSSSLPETIDPELGSNPTLINTSSSPINASRETDLKTHLLPSPNAAAHNHRLFSPSPRTSNETTTSLSKHSRCVIL